ncbi:hypothetical protein [Tautonia sociabilis]|uniref:PepSY domain-containing protein n=1 Tax=Tautonia sociabilis TaxID=2080755 RepID=A0A432MFR9_9BACT|nr:hypothetical protein [Tautonia sociabilis]RUL84946.1 hypothetical protein TsocGM_19595 [Tautonia sociabilis]
MTRSKPGARRPAFSAAASAAALLLALLPAVAGCGDRQEESARMARRTMTVASVPDEPRAAAEKALPGVEFEDAWANVDGEGQLHSYELRGRAANGRIREVRVSPSGEVLERE